jgi:hypothetical protein
MMAFGRRSITCSSRSHDKGLLQLQLLSEFYHDYPLYSTVDIALASFVRVMINFFLEWGAFNMIRLRHLHYSTRNVSRWALANSVT